MKDSAMKKRQKYEEFLTKVELLDTVDPYERAKISDALKGFIFKKGEYIVREVWLFIVLLIGKILGRKWRHLLLPGGGAMLR